jgi:excinuclease ABC subunit C
LDNTKDFLRAKIDTFPKKPGIYFFKDKNRDVIYIGKARSLRDRIKSYFAVNADIKVNSLLNETRDIAYILTGSEKEAVFLENNFIRQYQPKFNQRLKDDKSYPYLKMAISERFPGIYLTRKVEADGAKYFGPFSPARQARQTIRLISKYFGIRTCPEKIPGSRSRPCLEYDLKLCSGPCTGLISEREYKESLDNALLLLEGKVERLRNISREKMIKAAERENFEQAAQWRDLIHTLEHIKEKPKMISVGLDNIDIIGFAGQEEKAALYVFSMRKGKVIESESAVRKKTGTPSREDLLSSLLIGFYRGRKDWPKKILLPFFPADRQKLQQDIFHLSGKNILFLVPQRGKNRSLVELADRNAEIVLREADIGLFPLEEAKRALNLDSIPRRIEGFDISNTGGQESVGAVVVFENGYPQKKEYRKYRIRTVQGPDDVASLQEIIKRRFERMKKEKKDLPDLILVDGGKGQLNIALKTLKKIGLENLSVVSLAKKEEIIFTRAHKQGLVLDRTSSPLKLLQHVRDEAHRFAISYHRAKRKKRSFESELDGIPGLGPNRKSLVLAKYKDIAAVRRASIEDLAKITGKKVAARICEKLESQDL